MRFEYKNDTVHVVLEVNPLDLYNICYTSNNMNQGLAAETANALLAKIKRLCEAEE
jgi:hypothetical protein